MKFPNPMKLCRPAFLYLVVSFLFFFVILLQNFASGIDIYCVGNYSCNTSNIYLIFIIKAFYILFWTWILNLICSAGYSWVSWLLVLVPFILFFFLILMFLTVA